MLQALQSEKGLSHNRIRNARLMNIMEREMKIGDHKKQFHEGGHFSPWALKSRFFKC